MSFSLGGVSCAVHFHFCIREMFYRCEITQRDLSALDSCQGPSKLINLNSKPFLPNPQATRKIQDPQWNNQDHHKAADQLGCYMSVIKEM